MSGASRVLGRIAGLRPAVTRDPLVERDVRVSAADGTDLLTNVFRPRGGGPLPTILIRTPYGRTSALSAIAEVFAERGYHAVLQSCRGTFGSGGRIDFGLEASDSRVAADWIVGQPWSNGEIGTFGPSYLSLVQWALASTRPPQLKAMAIQIMSAERRRAMYPGGSFALDTALTWSYIVGHQELKGLAWLAANLRRSKSLASAYRHLPLLDADILGVGREVPMFRDWLLHDDPSDPYWAAVDYSGIIPTLEIPVSLVGGWYDYYLPYMLEDHAALVKAGTDVQLVVGPGPHASLSGLRLGLRQALAWLDAYLLGDRSRLDPAPVRVAMMGGGGWRSFDRWPPESRATRLFLHAGGRLLSTASPSSAPDRYRYDPADPTPAVGGSSLGSNSGPRDNRKLESRGDVLTYTGEALTSELEIAGPVAAELFVSSSVENTDFFARLCDVEPNGRSTNVCDGLIRLDSSRPKRNSNGAECVRIELWPTAYRFRPGHRLRLQVSSGAHPRYARNPGSGEPLATATTLVVADQAIHHDQAHPSALVIPVVSSG